MKDYQPHPDLLAGRVVLVTGAGDGIGRAAALTFARHGAQVILLGRTVAKLERVYDEIEQAGGQAAILPMDLAKASPEQYEQTAATITREFGRLDGILHNAAHLGTLTPLELYDLERWAQVFQVNLNAPFLLTQACLPLIKQSPDASIIFTSADVGRHARAYWGAYGISQFAIEGMAKTWSEELVENTRIRVNTLDPGAVNTAMRTRAYPGSDMARIAKPEDIMPVYLYLMGPDSRGVTGQALSAQS